MSGKSKSGKIIQLAADCRGHIYIYTQKAVAPSERDCEIGDRDIKPKNSKQKPFVEGRLLYINATDFHPAQNISCWHSIQKLIDLSDTSLS